MYRDILRNFYVLTKTLKCLCTLYLKNSNLQIFIHEKLCMKLQLNDETTLVDTLILLRVGQYWQRPLCYWCPPIDNKKVGWDHLDPLAIVGFPVLVGEIRYLEFRFWLIWKNSFINIGWLFDRICHSECKAGLHRPQDYRKRALSHSKGEQCYE